MPALFSEGKYSSGYARTGAYLSEVDCTLIAGSSRQGKGCQGETRLRHIPRLRVHKQSVSRLAKQQLYFSLIGDTKRLQLSPKRLYGENEYVLESQAIG
jgi:hypothetical protein